VRAYIKSAFPKLRYLITVCTGSGLVARTGILDGRRATTNKRNFRWAQAQGPNVNWAPKARWVVDEQEGKIPVWTSSGVSAGIDVMFAFVKHVYGEDEASKLSQILEYSRNTDANEDPFAVLLSAPNAG
jgi:transcriptional regulator GlxA family with amidase domain